jgi:hypothetical protein
VIRRLFSVLLALIIVIIIIGFLLPTTVVVERSRTVEAPPRVAFDVLADLRHFVRWAPWLDSQSGMSWRLEGPASGTGATLVWRETPEAAESRLRIVSVRAPERIDMALELADTRAESWFEIAPAGPGSEVRWGMRMSFGPLDLVGRYVGLLLPGLVGGDYDRGLERLDQYLAATPGRVPPLEAGTGDR